MSAHAYSAALLRDIFAAGVCVEPEREAPIDVPLRPAAVLVPLIDRPNGMQVMLTRRTDHLHHHPGQISFPGGRIEAHDASPVAAALRETEEETGLPAHQVELLGTLPDYPTVTGFRITPVVGLLPPEVVFKPDPFEVAEVFEVPLAFLADSANHRRHAVMWQGSRRHYWAMPWGDYNIWGATAGILVTLVRALSARR